MIPSRGENASPIVTVLGLAVAVVAIVGTRYFGWEWGSNQLLPTAIGVLVAVFAVISVVRAYRK